MGGRDDDILLRDSRRRGRLGLGLIEHFAGHHQVVRHDQRQPGAAIVEHDAAGEEPVPQFPAPPLEESPADDHGQAGGRNVNLRGAGTKNRLLLPFFGLLFSGEGKRTAERRCGGQGACAQEFASRGRLVHDW